ncbi:NAD-dependent epimerase/dehydratase family protein [Nocardia sp. NPDC004750]
MRVFLIGATGAIGTPAVEALIGSGYELTAMARTVDKALQLERQGADVAMVSMFDLEKLTEAFADHEAVINLATAIPATIGRFLRRAEWRENDRIRYEGSAIVAEAARRAGVRRLVQESVSMIYQDGGNRWLDETAPIDYFPMARGNLAAEGNARAFTGRERSSVILRFGLFYGPQPALSRQQLELARCHVALMIGPADAYKPAIHLTDAAAAVAAALQTAPGTYNIVDNHPLTNREWSDALGAAVGTRPWLRLPGRAALLLGDKLTSQTRSLRVCNHAFRAASGWSPHFSSAREGWADVASALSNTQ